MQYIDEDYYYKHAKNFIGRLDYKLENHVNHST